MASPQLRLLELLQIQGVRSETYAVLIALMRRCASDKRLSAFILRNVDKQVQKWDHLFSLSTLEGLAGCVSCPPASHCTTLRAVLLNAVAEALNHEGSQWLNDFLLIAIGKRTRQHRTYPSHPLSQGTIDECPSGDPDFEDLWDMVALRDGPRCCISGAIHNVTVVQLIPMSDDLERFARFRKLARVFFQADIPTLTDEQLRSPQNAVMLSMYWKDRLDKGCLIFKCVDRELHAIPHSRDDSDILAQERRANGLSGQSLVELCEGSAPQDYPCVHPQLAWLHRVLIETWHDTGLAEFLVDNIEWINRMPKKMQSTQFLDAYEFGSLLKHKLSLM